MEKQTDNTKFIIQRYDNYISGANTKGNFLIAFNTFIIGGLISNYSKISDYIDSGIGNIVFIISTYLLLALCSFSIILIIKAVYPFLKSGNSSIEKYHSHIFFESVAEFKDDISYFESLSNLTDKEFERDLANQAFQLAQGLKTKYSHIEWAMKLVYCELGVIILTTIIISIWK